MNATLWRCKALGVMSFGYLLMDTLRGVLLTLLFPVRSSRSTEYYKRLQAFEKGERLHDAGHGQKYL